MSDPHPYRSCSLGLVYCLAHSEVLLSLRPVNPRPKDLSLEQVGNAKRPEPVIMDVEQQNTQGGNHSSPVVDPMPRPTEAPVRRRQMLPLHQNQRMNRRMV